MKRLIILIAVMVAPMAGMATIDTWLNTGAITTAPQVDAINFVNQGTINIFTSLPFDTSNTRNFTNTGSMLGASGFRFDTAPSNNPGVRYMAGNFYNGPLLANGYGTVEAQDPGLNFAGANYGFSASYLLITATNIVNKGALAVGANGLLQLVGTNVNLKQSTLQVRPIGGGQDFAFSGNNTSSNFIPAKGISDVHWGQTNVTFFSSSIFNGTFPTAPQHPVTNGGFRTTASINGSFWPSLQTGGYVSTLDPSVLPDGVNVTVTNFDGTTSTFFQASNVVRQAVFVGGSSDPGLNVNISFSPSSSDTNDAKTVIVGITKDVPNLLTGTTDPLGVYFTDTLASETNRGVSKNLVTGKTYRPSTYSLDRNNFQFFGGIPTNATVDGNFLYTAGFDPNFNSLFGFQLGFRSNRVTAAYAGYAATVSSLVSGDALTSPTNLPGRVSINADVLDLTKTRIRAEGLLSISARHLVGSSGSVIDAGNLSYNIGSTNGNLVVEGLMSSAVNRFSGNIQAWSGVWNNEVTNVLINYTFNSTTFTYDFTPLTNTVRTRLYALVLDTSGLSTTQPVTVFSFSGHATNIIIKDPMMNVQSLLFDCRNLTLSNNLSLALSWNVTNAPNLLNFTNLAVLTIPGDAYFGEGQPVLNTFENQGSISSIAQLIHSTNVYITNGFNSASGLLSIVSQTNLLLNANLQAGGDLRLSSQVCYLSNTLISAGGKLYLNATNSLTDGGWGSSNQLVCNSGFETTVKPPVGDLLGSTITSLAASFADVEHIWPASNLGASKAGFTNNLALGRLILNGGNGSSFTFSGTGVSNAIYVDSLELLNGAASFDGSYNAAALNLNPNLHIYYAQALANGFSVADKLNGKNNNQLHWISSFIGPFSGTNYIYPDGSTNTFNAALAQKADIDSDNDGIVNSLDPTPFFVPGQVQLVVTVTNLPPPTALLSWQSPPRATNTVFYATSISATNWQVLTNFVTPVILSGPPVNLMISDPVNPAVPRYYEVRVDL